MGLRSVFRSEGPIGTAIYACRGHFFAAAIFSAFINALYLAPTIFMLQVYDRVLSSGSKGTLGLLSLVLTSAITALVGLEWLRARILIRCSSQLDLHLALPVMHEILGQQGLSRSERVRHMRDFDLLRQTIAGSGALAAFDAPWIPVYIAAAFLLHPLLGGLCILACLAMFTLAFINERVTAPLIGAANNSAAQAYARQDFTSSWAEEVRALGMVEHLVRHQSMDRAGMIGLQAEASFAANDVGAVIKFLRLALQSAALGVAALLALDGKLSPSALMGGSFLLIRCLAPVEQIVAAWKGIVGSRNAYSGLKKLLDKGALEARKTALPRPKGEISVEGVLVLSPQGDRVGLADVSFALSAGEMLAVTGPSGSGKSSLMRALAGAAVIARGAIRLDGASLGDWPAQSLSQHVGYMPQDFTLFPGTIKENISRFANWVDQDEVDRLTVEAAKRIGAHEMILRTPNGYDTRVGLGGLGMSGGQTQRIALARAMFGSPAVLVLDEPDAHLDLEGESALAAALHQLRLERVTIIAAAHRGGIVSFSDKMIVLNAGRVQAFGALRDLAAAMRRSALEEPAAGHAEIRRATA
jgi:PrtD family type I secretion system ABC transporter